MIYIQLAAIVAGFIIIIIIIDYLFGGNMWNKIKNKLLIIWGVLSGVIVLAITVLCLIMFGKKTEVNEDIEIIKKAKEKFDEKLNSTGPGKYNDDGTIR